MDGICIYSVSREFPEQLIGKLSPPATYTVKRNLPGISSQYVLDVCKMKLTFNVMSAENIPSHLDGFVGYVNYVYKGKPNARGKQIIDQVKRTRMVIGVLFEPDDAEPTVPLQVSMIFAEWSKAMVFVRGTLFDAYDRVILAPDGTFERKAIINPLAPPRPWWKFW